MDGSGQLSLDGPQAPTMVDIPVFVALLAREAQRLGGSGVIVSDRAFAVHFGKREFMVGVREITK